MLTDDLIWIFFNPNSFLPHKKCPFILYWKYQARVFYYVIWNSLSLMGALLPQRLRDFYRNKRFIRDFKDSFGKQRDSHWTCSKFLGIFVPRLSPTGTWIEKYYKLWINLLGKQATVFWQIFQDFFQASCLLTWVSVSDCPKYLNFVL